jgi:hypothetical protein
MLQDCVLKVNTDQLIQGRGGGAIYSFNVILDPFSATMIRSRSLWYARPIFMISPASTPTEGDRRE